MGEGEQLSKTMADQGISSSETAVWDIFEQRWVQAALCLAVALALRAPSFGDPSIHVDEGFYVLVGQKMHDGMLPYVDIWDRKPPVLFMIYWLIAFLPGIILPYQLVATGFAAATAFVIARLTNGLGAKQMGPIFAALVYLMMLPVLGGGGGQGPVFYNFFTALAGLLVWNARGASEGKAVLYRLWFAMLLCGLAIGTKQTAMFEAAFLGLFASWRLYSAGESKRRLFGFMAVAVAAGVAPMLLAYLYYASSGHSAEFLHAMITSNFTKQDLPSNLILNNLTKTGLLLLPILVLAAIGLFMAFRVAEKRGASVFLAGWMIAAAIGFASVPNAYEHYALPLLVPASLAGAFALTVPIIGLAISLGMLWWSNMASPIDPQNHTRARDSMTRLVSTINQNLGSGERRVLIYDGSPVVYALTNSLPGTPLAFPQHMLVPREYGVSHLDHAQELRRVIAARPRVVVMRPQTKDIADPAGYALVTRYVAENCQLIAQDSLFYGSNKREDYLVYGNCWKGG